MSRGLIKGLVLYASACQPGRSAAERTRKRGSARTGCGCSGVPQAARNRLAAARTIPTRTAAGLTIDQRSPGAGITAEGSGGDRDAHQLDLRRRVGEATDFEKGH